MEDVMLDWGPKFFLRAFIHKNGIPIKGSFWVRMFHVPENWQLHSCLVCVVSCGSLRRHNLLQIDLVSVSMSVQILYILCRRHHLIQLFRPEDYFLEANEISIEFVYVPLQ